MITDRHLEDLVRREHDQYPEPDPSLLARIAARTYAADPADHHTPLASAGPADDPVFETEEQAIAHAAPRFRSKQLLLGLALLAPLAVAVGVVVGRQAEPNVQPVSLTSAATSGSQQAGDATLQSDLTTQTVKSAPPFPLSSVFAVLDPATSTTAPEILKIANDVRDGIPEQLFNGETPGEPIVWKLASNTWGPSVDYYIVSFGGDLLCHFGVTPIDSRIRGVGCGDVADIQAGTPSFGWAAPGGAVFFVPDSVSAYAFSAKGNPLVVVPAVNNVVQAPAQFDAITVRFVNGDTSPTQTYSSESQSGGGDPASSAAPIDVSVEPQAGGIDTVVVVTFTPTIAAGVMTAKRRDSSGRRGMRSSALRRRRRRR